MDFSKKNHGHRSIKEMMVSKTKLTLLMLFVSVIAIAQNGINYKAIIKDTNGNAVTNSLVAVQFRILSTPDQLLAYEEIHTPTTDSNGLIIINIGEGTSNTEFPESLWGTYDDHFLNVQIDIGGGYVDMGTTQFKQVPLAIYSSRSGYARLAYEVSNIKGLDRINGEGNSFGWRLAGVNPNFYGTIGQSAVDLSVGLPNSVTGATGDYSFASGIATLATDSASTAMGQGTIASGNVSTALGVGGKAVGDFSTAMGFSTNALGKKSTALGAYSVAFGENSFAGGSNTEAIGRTSSTFGYNTVAQSYTSFVIGQFNAYGGNSEYWSPLNQIFVIGNGTSDSNRNNAMTVLGNGYVGIGTQSPQELLHISGGRLRIGDEIIEDGGNDVLAFSSSLVPTIDEGDRLGGPNRKWLDVYAANGTIQTSDKRSKTNIANLNYGLNEVLQMQPVSFNWKNKNNPDTKLGLIAQDLQTLVPEVVHSHIWEKDEATGTLTKKELDRLGVYYSDLVPVLIKAIQEQQKIIEMLNADKKLQKAEFSKLKANHQSMLSRIENLEVNQSN